MSINNKWELLAALSESELQGFDSQGLPMTFSVFEDMEYSRAITINQHINDTLREFLMAAGKQFELTPVQFLRLCIGGIELRTPEEVGQFMFHAGYMLGILENSISKEGGEQL